ncbi:8-amino-7-oxononanoate synthase, partial [Vibrio cholerae]
QGIWVSAIRPPTVPVGSARLRITITAAHTQAHIRRLSEQLKHVMEKDT